MKCALGPKKTRRIEAIIGRPVRAAVVRGGWEHYWANVFCQDGTVWWVNYKTGESELDMWKYRATSEALAQKVG